jgi:hypothetical protein
MSKRGRGIPRGVPALFVCFKACRSSPIFPNCAKIEPHVESFRVLPRPDALSPLPAALPCVPFCVCVHHNNHVHGHPCRRRLLALSGRGYAAIASFGACYSPSDGSVLRCPAPFFLITIGNGMR